MQPCEVCGKQQDDHWPGDKGELCQECWERACSAAWWESLQERPAEDPYWDERGKQHQTPG